MYLGSLGDFFRGRGTTLAGRRAVPPDAFTAAGTGVGHTVWVGWLVGWLVFGVFRRFPGIPYPTKIGK